MIRMSIRCGSCFRIRMCTQCPQHKQVRQISCSGSSLRLRTRNCRYPSIERTWHRSWSQWTWNRLIDTCSPTSTSPTQTRWKFTRMKTTMSCSSRTCSFSCRKGIRKVKEYEQRRINLTKTTRRSQWFRRAGAGLVITTFSQMKTISQKVKRAERRTWRPSAASTS